MTIQEELKVSGLSCGGCVETVSDRLASLPGVEDVTVELQPGGVSTASVRSENGLDRDEVERVLSENSGFRLA